LQDDLKSLTQAYSTTTTANAAAPLIAQSSDASASAELQ